MYKKGGEGDWIPIDPYCFVKPIKKEVKDSFFKLSPDQDSYKGNIPNMGTLEYPNKNLLDQGAKAGDTVIFSKYSEYEFDIDGEIYYKMSTKDILGVL
jgi:co-chaperonin GroES (HSP10)